MHRQQMIGTEARIYIEHGQQTTNHESRTDQQHRGQTDFDHDQGSAHGLRVSSVELRSFFQDRNHFGARDMQRGENPEEHASENAGRGREQQDRNADVDLLRPENVCWLERENGFDSPARDQQTDEASNQTEDKTFRDHLSDEFSAACPESFADCQLLLPRHCAGQHEIRQVRARDQQDQSHGREQYEQVSAEILAYVFDVHGKEVHAEASVQRGILLFEALADHFHFSASLLEGNARRNRA